MSKDQYELESLVPDCADRLVQAWCEVLIDVNPILASTEVRSRVERSVANLLDLLAVTPFDPDPARELGASLEMLDSFRPEDLQTLQETLMASFVDSSLPDRRPPLLRMSRLLFALGAGFYIGKTRRAKALDMSAMSKMSHDLKTPINAITGFSRLILKGIDGPITDFQREDLTSIYEAGQHLLTMVNDLYSVRKRDAARALVYDSSFEVTDLLADVLRTIQPIAADREHTIEIRLTPDLGRMEADASMVRWIFLGVLQHLVRQSSGSVISIVVARQEGERSWLTAEIGCRLSDAVLAYRDFTSDEGEGDVGATEDIAIITCRRFCEDLGGDLSRAEGQNGVTFTIRLPASLLVQGASK
ncbi:MAG: sensor histidine kinase [Anaerolineae bacterium]